MCSQKGMAGNENFPLSLLFSPPNIEDFVSRAMMTTEEERDSLAAA
jgi:hypothetical protein